ncbi:MAG: two-component sensor histidine kinase [Deltaproteobacteria bacterium]|nr:MAG: two-component sensor histidine kinase [Deltaproteobacteria bacterium]
MSHESTAVLRPEPAAETGVEPFPEQEARLLAQVRGLELRVRKAEERHRALLHVMGDMNELNKRLTQQRKALLHVLVDCEQDRRRCVGETERLQNSRRALMHILEDFRRSSLRLENGRKAMIHIMGDLRETTREVQRREQEVRDKQEQLVQAGKLATVGELTTGIAHELNNPLNNIGLFVGNAVDYLELGGAEKAVLLEDLRHAMEQVRKATQIISHIRAFGRPAPVDREPLRVNDVVRRSLALLQQQLHLRQIDVRLDLCPEDPLVLGNSIQLEQVFINLLTNARDALSNSAAKLIDIDSSVREGMVQLRFHDTGPGVPRGLEQRIFDPFFTTKDVDAGTGLGLSIAHGIIREHEGSIAVVRDGTGGGSGATFRIELPLCAGAQRS